MRSGGGLTVDVGSSPGPSSVLSQPQSINETSSLLHQGGGVNALIAPPRRLEEEGNAVEKALYSTLYCIITILVLVLVGVLALLLRHVSSRLAFLSYWVLFTPFWLADIVGVGLQIYLLVLSSTLRFSSPEQKRNILQYGTRTVASRSISMEMLPLVKRIIFTTLLTIPVLSLVTASQVLICAHLEHGHPTTLFKAFFPLIFLQLLALLECLLIRTRSGLGALSWALALISTVTLVLRPSGELPPLTEAPLWVAFIPLWSLQLVFAIMIAYIITCGCVGRYRLTSRHVTCLALYVTSLVFLTLAEVLYCLPQLIRLVEDTILPLANQLNHFKIILPSMLIFLGLGVAVLAMCLVLDEEVDYLVTTYGYEAPLPLSWTTDGWEPTGAGISYWLLLGRIEVAAGGRRQAKGTKGKAVAESPTGGAFSSFEARGMRRTNSGSYMNLYEEV